MGESTITMERDERLTSTACEARLLEPLPENQQVMTLNERILAENGVTLSRDSHILDFGCGRGRHVREYLAKGYRNVYGFDQQDCIDSKERLEAGRFRFARDGRMAELPYPDAFFDFVYSYSVMEHVMDPELALREIHRVLKPGGVSLHNFPSKWRPIEPHMFIPFGGAIQSYGYMLFWALLGVRNHFQKGLPAREVARRNHLYAQTGVNYLGGAELERLLSRIFEKYSYQEVAFLKHSCGNAHMLYGLVKALPPLRRIFRFAHTRMVLLEKAGTTA